MAKNMEVDASVINRSDYRAFLQNLGYDLTRRNIDEIIFLAALPDGESENIKSPLALFKSLESHGHLHPTTNGLNYLKELMEAINRHDLARKVQRFGSEEQISKKRTEILTPQKPFLSMSHGTKEVTKKAILKKPGDYMKKKGSPTLNDEEATCMKNSEESIASSPTKHYTQRAVSNDEPSATKGNMAVCGEDPTSFSTAPAAKGNLAPSNEWQSELPSVKANQGENNMDIFPPADQEEGFLGSGDSSSCFARPPITAPTDDAEFIDPVNSDSYRMKSVPRGVCVILNNEEFQQSMDKDNYLQDREGSSVDAENLEDVFRSFGFDVESKKNLTAMETRDYFQRIAKMDHSNYDCFVGCILSHGCQDGFYGVDGKVVTVNEILLGFKTCSSLKEKPKIFFGQFCRGEIPDEIVPDCITDYNIFKENPSEADYYIAYATPPGYVSWRSKLNGTWFISKLCYWLREKGSEMHLDDIMTKVKRDVAKSYTSDYYKQIPFVCGTLTKTLKFI